MRSNSFLKFSPHPELYNSSGEPTHAFMSPSQGAWINDDREKFIQRYDNFYAKQRGTEIHDSVSKLIRFIKKFPELGITGLKGKGTVSLFVNDVLKMRMDSEVPLRYSDICYGFADAAQFDIRHNVLRISDLKTGIVPAKFRQLEIYAALLLLEYEPVLTFQHHVDLENMIVELRIYQFDDIQLETRNYYDILEYMEKIRTEHEWLSEELERRDA